LEKIYLNTFLNSDITFHHLLLVVDIPSPRDNQLPEKSIKNGDVTMESLHITDKEIHYLSMASSHTPLP